jgi:hypothetical protein
MQDSIRRALMNPLLLDLYKAQHYTIRLILYEDEQGQVHFVRFVYLQKVSLCSFRRFVCIRLCAGHLPGSKSASRILIRTELQ